MDYEIIEPEILDDTSDINSGKSELSNANLDYYALENALKDSNSLIIRKVYSSSVEDVVITNARRYDPFCVNIYSTSNEQSLPKFVSGICTYGLYLKCGNGQSFKFNIDKQKVNIPCRLRPEAKNRIKGKRTYPHPGSWFDIGGSVETLDLDDVYPPNPEEWYDDEVSRKYSEKLIELSDIVKKYGFIIERKLFYKLCNTPSFMEIYLEKEDSDSKLMEKLEKIIALHDSGKLSDEEFKLLKEKLIRTS